MSKILNVEIKARCSDGKALHKKLISLGADYRGLDHQIDTYFKCSSGRLKLREGKIENSLIFYKRDDQAGPKASDIALTKLTPDTNLKEVLSSAYGVQVVVDKKRHIFFIENVKFHIDEVVGLGSFMEIEAIDENGSLGIKFLQQQCEQFMQTLGVAEKDLIEQSYSDLIYQD